MKLDGPGISAFRVELCTNGANFSDDRYDQGVILSACSGLVEPDSTAVCLELSRQINTLRWHPWVTAAIGAGAAALTAFLSTRGSLASSKTERRVKSQREALYGAQDATQELHAQWLKVKAWTDSGEVGKSPLGANKEQNMLASFDKIVSRIDDNEIRSKFKHWREVGRLYFFGADGFDLHGEKSARTDAIESASREAAKLDK